MPASGEESLEADHNSPTDAPTFWVVVQWSSASQKGRNLEQVTPPVATNVFMRTL